MVVGVWGGCGGGWATARKNRIVEDFFEKRRDLFIAKLVLARHDINMTGKFPKFMPKTGKEF